MKNWAGDRVRTGDIQLGRLTLYQLSYSRFMISIKSFLDSNTNIVIFNTILMSGESRIRTCEVKNNRFTVCPRWPLEYLPSNNYCFNIFKNMSRWRDSNPRPADYKSAALASWATSAILKLLHNKKARHF